MVERTGGLTLGGAAQKLRMLISLGLFIAACQPALISFRAPNKNELQAFAKAQGITPITDKLLKDSAVMLYETSGAFGYYQLATRVPDGAAIVSQHVTAARSAEPILILGQFTGDQPFVAVIIQDAALLAKTAAVEIALDTHNYLSTTTDGEAGVILVAHSPVKAWKAVALYSAEGRLLYSQADRARQQLRVMNSGRQAIRGLVVLFPGLRAESPATRVEFGDVPAGGMTEYENAPTGVYGYAAYEYTVDGRVVSQPVVDWVGESPRDGTKFTYRVELDPQGAPGLQIELKGVAVDVP